MPEELSIQGTLAETTVPDLFRSLVRSSETAIMSLEAIARKAGFTEPGRLRAAQYFEKAIGVLSAIGAEYELALAQCGYARLCRPK